MLDEAASVARLALARSPAEAFAAGSGSGMLAGRIEGAGVVGSHRAFRTWAGMPAEPGPAPGPGPDWSVRVEGLWSRLVVESAPDAEGQVGLASFLLDGPRPSERFLEVLSGGTAGDVAIRVELVDDADALGDAGSAPRRREASGLLVPLASPRGEVLALATLRGRSPEALSTFRAGIGEALAAIALALLLATLFDWGAICRSSAGAAAAIAAVGLARIGLLVSRAVPRLLPRELGSPTLYGSREGLGLLGSPAELLLTCLAVFLVGRALRAALRARRATSPRGTALLAGAAALATTVLLVGLASMLARDARISVVELGSLFRSAPHALLLASLALVLVTAAEAWALLASMLRSAAHEGPLRAAAVALIPLAVLATAGILRTSEHLRVDRLRSEFAPEVLEQESRRRVALVAAAREAAEADDAADSVLAVADPGDSYAAYLLWAAGDLFHSGSKSSLDLYDAAGQRRSHFGFDLPALPEQVALPGAGEESSVRTESFDEGARSVTVLHTAAPIVRERRVIGTVVAHVIDEPDNLAFLPSSLPYLAALGFGAPHADAQDNREAPGYVLYDSDGSVLLSTVGQPPAPTPALRAAAAAGRTVRVLGGAMAFVALPLADGERLHLLLLPALTWLDRLGATLRLYLIGTAALLLAALVPIARRPRALLALLGAVRGSFYRKLVVALLLASVVPVLTLSLFVRGYVGHRAQTALVESASRLVQVVKSVIEDYAASEVAEEPMAAVPELSDEILHWLRRVVRQEIHLYENGIVIASSKRELFASGLLPVRLPGEVQQQLVRERLPYVVRSLQLGGAAIPVAYARLRLPGVPPREAIAAVPLVVQQRDLDLVLDRVSEMLLLSSALLALLLAGSAAALARSVARPVRDLVDATRRIAAGDTATRLAATTSDELAQLVEGFNTMAGALAAQRADLERRRDYIETLLRNATTGVLSTDPGGRIVTLNPAAAELLATAAGRPRVGEELVPAIARAGDLAPLARALADGTTPEPREIDLEHAGRARRLRLVRVPLPDPEGGPPGSLLLLDDVTDLMRSNQLAAWAEMARAIAHEIKNPLTPIQLSTEHLARLLRDRGVLPWPEVEACVETVIKQVRALRQISAEFSAYAKLPDLKPVPVDPAELMREALAPYRSAPPPGIAIEERYAACPAISADRRVLSRAIVNLVENALHAMADGGTLSLATSEDRARGQVVLEVTDTGPGLAPGVRARLFEPYFSTKSSGTGLGLAIARRAVEGHHGTIEVDGAPGRGTTFRIRLPAAE